MPDAPLLAPLPLRCGATWPNRLVLAPLTNQQSHPDGTLSDAELRWLVRRAAGGFGAVVTCAAHVTREGQGFDGQLGVWSDDHRPGLARLASAVAAHGAVPLVQLYHGGVRSPSRLTGVQPLSAVAFHEDQPGFEVPRPATPPELDQLVAAFRDAAARSVSSGFGGVELHGAHGYLLGQFLSRVNDRTDGWGDDLPGRARLIREVARAVRAAVGSAVVGVRLSPEDMGNARGLDLDETVQVARWLCDDGVDYVHLSLWDHRKPTRKRPDVHPVPLFRAALPSEVALLAAGDVWTAEEAAWLHARGADGVVVGRAAILDPDWPRRVIAGGEAPVRGPRSPAALAAVEVSPAFVTYLRRFRNLVEEAGS